MVFYQWLATTLTSTPSNALNMNWNADRQGRWQGFIAQHQCWPWWCSGRKSLLQQHINGHGYGVRYSAITYGCNFQPSTYFWPQRIFIFSICPCEFWTNWSQQKVGVCPELIFQSPLPATLSRKREILHCDAYIHRCAHTNTDTRGKKEKSDAFTHSCLSTALNRLNLKSGCIGAVKHVCLHPQTVSISRKHLDTRTHLHTHAHTYSSGDDSVWQ